MRDAGGDKPEQCLRPVLVWVAVVAALSGLGLLPFFAFVPDLSKFTGNSTLARRRPVVRSVRARLEVADLKAE